MTLEADAYDVLVAAKLEGESLSELVLRLVGPRVRLSDYAGAWEDLPSSTLRELRAYLAGSDGNLKA